jgi:Tfp pilus assembly protein PilF
VNVRLAEDASQIDTRDKVEAARRAAAKGISLDDSNAEAHGALAGSIFIKDWNFRGAVEQFQRAVALDPTRMNPATA